MRTVRNVFSTIEQPSRLFTYLEVIYVHSEKLIPCMASIEKVDPSYYFPILIGRNEPMNVGDLILDTLVGGFSRCTAIPKNNDFLYKIYGLPDNIHPKIIEEVVRNKTFSGLYAFEVLPFYEHDPEFRIKKVTPNAIRSKTIFKLTITETNYAKQIQIYDAENINKLIEHKWPEM